MTTKLISAIFISSLLLCGLTGCPKKPAQPAKTGAGEEPKAQPKAQPKTATAMPAKPATPQPPPKMTFLSGSHILLAYKGAMRAKPDITRTKEEAQKLATELAAEARKDPSKFAELAQKNSNGPSGPKGGSLGTWPKGRMVPAFDKAITAMKVGEISDPVETPFGFHVIKRDKLPTFYAGSHILLAYKGAMRARPDLARTKEDAQKLATELAAKAKAAPDTFAELAKKNSDGPSAARGGKLGVWPAGQMVPAFDKAIQKLKMGEISDPVETPFGFHVMMREDPTTSGM